LGIKISPELRKALVEEFRLVEKKIREEKTIRKKLFFLSATYGQVTRVFNISYDPQLILMHLVLNAAYSTIGEVVKRIQEGRETVIKLPENYFEKLAELIKELAELIEKDEDTYSVLQKIAVLTYAITGNGYYLYLKGILKI